MDQKAEIKKLFFEYVSCNKCADLCANRTQVVFGAGKVTSPDIMVIGESPGDQDEKQGMPFVGEPGNILQKAMDAADLPRDSVYMTNTVLCRPVTIEQGNKGPYKKNREPLKTEMDACRERLYREIYVVDPKLILLIGAKAASLVTRSTMTKAAGQMHTLKFPGRQPGVMVSYPALVTYHPSFLIRSGSTEPTPGSYAEQFYENIERAARIVRVSREFTQKELNV